MLVVPIAFTSDHIETLYELDIEVKEKAHKSGVTNFFRSPSINDDPLMGTLMAELVADHLKSGQVSSAQYSLRYTISGCWLLLCCIVCCWWLMLIHRLRCGGCSSPQCRNILNPVSAYTRPSLPWHPDDKKY